VERLGIVVISASVIYLLALMIYKVKKEKDSMITRKTIYEISIGIVSNAIFNYTTVAQAAGVE